MAMVKEKKRRLFEFREIKKKEECERLLRGQIQQVGDFAVVG